LKLVIVESPAKAKTISKILGKEYVVESSIGHIRDLPADSSEIPAKYKAEKWSRMGVNIEKDFEPLYVVSKDKKKQVKKLKDLLKDATELYLATDEDREGESISWHLLEVLKPKIPVKRLAFHEITESAIQAALDNPRQVDSHMVTAQATRRVLDRLYGYELSPLLWRKIAPKLSAGRVQSVATRLIVEKERARMAFKSAAYMSVEADFLADKSKFKADLREYEGQKVAGSKDFDANTGEAKNKVLVLNKDNIEQVIERIKSEDFMVDNVVTKPMKTSPKPPFTTSTLQQDANHKLGFSSKRTMQVAQKLYENGYITYMRTDSISLSSQAINACRAFVSKDFGDEYLPEKVRLYKSKVKNAQEAHEAIRPAGSSFRSPKQLSSALTEEQLKLYSLIFKRTVASQMKDFEFLQTSADIVSKSSSFRANGRVTTFAGFRKLYAEHGAVIDDGQALPELKAKQAVALEDCETKQHATKPPARYNEATLVKALEAKGIGRPSTYASIIDTIIRRRYVFKLGKALVPTFMAFGVVRLMEQNFMFLVDYDFTAKMEEDLDAISRGEIEFVEYLKQFYYGQEGTMGLKEITQLEIDPKAACTLPIEGADDIDLRIGRFGPFLEMGEKKVSIPEGTQPDMLTPEFARELIETQAQLEQAGSLGDDPDTKMPVFAKVGRFGPYVQLGEKDENDKNFKPKMKSIPKGYSVEQVDLKLALKLLSLPRVVATTADGEEVVADIGRYGPYLKSKSKTASVAVELVLDPVEKDILAALEAGKQTRGPSKQVLKEFEGSAIKIMNGRYGPYVNEGKINASLTKGLDPATVTLEQAQEILADKKK